MGIKNILIIVAINIITLVLIIYNIDIRHKDNIKDAQSILENTYDKEINNNFKCETKINSIIGTDMSDIQDGGDGKEDWKYIDYSSEYKLVTDGKITHKYGKKDLSIDNSNITSNEEINQYIDMSDTNSVKLYEPRISYTNDWYTLEIKDKKEINQLFTEKSIVYDKSFIKKMFNASIIEETDSMYIIESYVMLIDIKEILGSLVSEVTINSEDRHYIDIKTKVLIHVDKDRNKISYLRFDMTEEISQLLDRVSTSYGLSRKAKNCLIEINFSNYGQIKSLEIPQEVIDSVDINEVPNPYWWNNDENDIKDFIGS